MLRFLDTETTGLDPIFDEILEIAVVDEEGRTCLHSLVRPKHHVAWPSAQAINGISPEIVADAPTLEELRPRILEAIAGCEVVTYGAAFDAGFLGSEICDAATAWHCALERFAQRYGEWDQAKGRWRYKNLRVAAEYYGFEWPGDAHRALADTLACRHVWQALEAGL